MTVCGLVAGVVAAGVTAVGWFGVALALVAVSGACDALDGSVARAGNSAHRGQVLDSVCDRIVDSCWYAGLVWWAAEHAGPVALSGFLVALVASSWSSYLRARVESDGQTASRVGGRLERVVVLLVALGVLAVAPATSGIVALVVGGHAAGGFVWRAAHVFRKPLG